MDVLGQDRREGLGKRSESRAAPIALGVISALLLLSSLYSAEASVFRKARETVVDAAAPALAFLSQPVTYIQRVVGEWRDYFNVLEQNQALREENAELRQWMNEALALRETIAAYERLQSYYAPPDAKPIDAFVIGESNDAFAHSMLVNVGARHGVARGQAVVDDRGLVGRIVATGDKASRILLLTDVQSRIPVFIEEAGLEGIMVGRTRSQPAIEFTDASDDVPFAKGQRVVTSGAGGVLPRGMPVGVVAGTRDGAPVIDLYAEYSKTRIVRIINYEFPEIGEEVAVTHVTAQPKAPVAATASAAAQPLPELPSGIRTAPPPPPPPGDPNEENVPPVVEDAPLAAPAPQDEAPQDEVAPGNDG